MEVSIISDILSPLGDVASVGLLLLIWRLDRRILTLEIHFGIKELKTKEN